MHTVVQRDKFSFLILSKILMFRIGKLQTYFINTWIHFREQNPRKGIITMVELIRESSYTLQNIEWIWRNQQRYRK